MPIDGSGRSRTSTLARSGDDAEGLLPEKHAADYPACVRQVSSFEELVVTPLADGINALCWQRRLPAGFAEVAARFAEYPGVTPLKPEVLTRLEWSEAGAEALAWMLKDFERLRDRGLQPELNHVREYPRDDPRAVVRTDVYSFHVDRSPIEVDTYLCTYFGVASEGLDNAQASLRVALPVVRARLLQAFGGQDDATFVDHLREHHFDLHYAPTQGARPWSFGVGHLWRVATAWPGSRVAPCIHRAPPDAPGTGRLLLIS